MGYILYLFICWSLIFVTDLYGIFNTKDINALLFMF